VEIDVDMAAGFVATHGRLLERRRLEHLLGRGEAGDVLAALAAYHNPDGGYGWGLEPDLRAAESQPAAAMHALEVMAEVAPVTTTHAVELCDWLAAHTLADGGLPFALPIRDTAGCAPLWTTASSTASSLQMTSQVAANAHRVGRHDPAVASHPWLPIATAYCVEAIAAIDATPHAHELRFALRFLDAAADAVADGHDLLERLRPHVPPQGSMHVEGGAPDETLEALDFAPDPDGPARRLFAPEVVAADLERLANQQQPDGGWPVAFASSSPAGALEWRGYATVGAIAVLGANQP